MHTRMEPCWQAPPQYSHTPFPRTREVVGDRYIEWVALSTTIGAQGKGKQRNAFNVGAWVGSYAPRSLAHQELQALAKRVQTILRKL